MKQDSPVIFDRVNFSYPEKPLLLNDFSMTLPSSGVVCLFGASGCGKTTLMRLIAGLEKPLDGMITGLDNRRASCVFQEDRLLGWLSILENVALVSDKQNAERLLGSLGLGNECDRFPSTLSGGMKRRAAIARALAAKGDILLLDEPFNGLDHSLWNSVVETILREYPPASGKLVVLITHVAQHAEAMNAVTIHLHGPPLRI